MPLGEKNGHDKRWMGQLLETLEKCIATVSPERIYFVFCFGITYDCVKRVQTSNNTLLDKPVNGVACPSNVESEAPNMRIDIQKRNM